MPHTFDPSSTAYPTTRTSAGTSFDGESAVGCLADLTEPTERVRRLRARALDHAHERWQVGGDEAELAAARSWLRTGSDGSHILRRGIMAGDILRSLAPAIDPDELLVGKFSGRPLTDGEAAELVRWREVGAPATSKALGQRAHMAIDYERVLRLGVVGTRDLIGRLRNRLDLTRTDHQESDLFYEACLAALDGMVSLAHAYADLADRLAVHEQDEARRSELSEIAVACRRVPEHPASTFREAMQSVHFVTFCQCAGNRMLLFQLGRPDRYLWPYYAADMAAGRITQAEAQELIDCAGILLNEYTPRGLAVGWMVGGRDAAGRDVSNDLTYLCVQSTGHVRLAYPGIGLCWTPDTPADLTRLACRQLARGATHPALFADDVVTRGLLGLGLPHRDACEYVHSTCVEITPVAISNVYVASPYYNLVQLLHDAMGLGGRCPDGTAAVVDVAPPASFDELLAAFEARVREAIKAGTADQNRAMMSRAHAGGFPLLSCFVNDCLGVGRDIDSGGARANWIESSFVGLANLVDALSAIRQCVFEDRSIAWGDLIDALARGFEGADDIRGKLARAPKYGNDDDAVDGLANWVTGMLLRECDRYRTYWGGPVVPGFFCWIMHERLGAETGASADGRASGFPFADGSGPAQGREKAGPTAMVRSVTKWDHAPMIGGIAVNMRFQQSGDPDELVEPMQSVLETFLRLGGFEAQVNVVDPATLRAAQERPNEYRDLVVRIAGYSDYFVGLSREMQAEVIARSEMCLS